MKPFYIKNIRGVKKVVDITENGNYKTKSVDGKVGWASKEFAKKISKKEAKANWRFKKLKQMNKKKLLRIFSRYNKVHSASNNILKSDLIYEILEDEGYLRYIK